MSERNCVTHHICDCQAAKMKRLEERIAALESEPLAAGYTRPDIAIRLKKGFSVMICPELYGTGTLPVTITERHAES